MFPLKPSSKHTFEFKMMFGDMPVVLNTELVEHVKQIGYQSKPKGVNPKHALKSCIPP